MFHILKKYKYVIISLIMLLTGIGLMICGNGNICYFLFLFGSAGGGISLGFIKNKEFERYK